MGTGFWDHVRTVADHLYDFALTLGGPGLFFIALADSSFLSVPEANDILIVVLSTGQSWTMMSYYVVMTIVGSTTGCSLLYGLGKRGGMFMRRRLSPERIKRAEALYQRWGIWSVVIPSLLPPPTPFKVFVLSAGLFKIPYRRFLAAVVAGRSLRYFLWGILAVIYGEAAKRYLQQNLHKAGTVLFIVFVAGGAIYISLKLRKKAAQQGVA